MEVKELERFHFNSDDGRELGLQTSCKKCHLILQEYSICAAQKYLIIASLFLRMLIEHSFDL